MRIAIFSHAHPNFSKGGGEIAAYSLFQALNATEQHEAWFIARAEQQMLHLGSPVGSLNAREYLIGGNADIPRMTSTITLGDDSDFADMLRTISPDVIHFHHYVFLGLEMIHAAKRVCPHAKIVLTLHEFIAICMNSGQMIKTDGRLCYRASPRDCHGCFPGWTMEDLFLREINSKAFFELVDEFISPSGFLRDRYVAWGLPADKITVLENGLEPGPALPLRSIAEGQVRGRFAYFGQINKFKGIDLILEAFIGLPRAIRKMVTLDIYGSGLEAQEEWFRARIEALLREANGQSERSIRFHGAYEREELPHLMAGIDWVVMGSTWWENSPVVIQEAFKYGRPVICPDIGGMAEKVKPGQGGLNFRARDSVALRALITEIATQQVDYEDLLRTMPAFINQTECADAHLKLYA